MTENIRVAVRDEAGYATTNPTNKPGQEFHFEANY